MQINESRILKAIEEEIVRKAPDCIHVDYRNKIEINSIVKEAYLKLDRDRIIGMITQDLEEKIASKVVNKLLTELGNDVKEIMSNKNYRDDLKFHLRKTVDEICSRVSDDQA